MRKHSSKVKSVQQEVFAMLMMAKDSVAAFRENIGNYSYIDVIEKQLLSTQEAISKNDLALICHIEKAGHIMVEIVQDRDCNSFMKCLLNIK